VAGKITKLLQNFPGWFRLEMLKKVFCTVCNIKFFNSSKTRLLLQGDKNIKKSLFAYFPGWFIWIIVSIGKKANEIWAMRVFIRIIGKELYHAKTLTIIKIFLVEPGRIFGLDTISDSLLD
jgi:hypothetical protein